MVLDMDVLTDAALRVAVAISPGTKVLEIGVRDGNLAESLLQLSLAYTGCDLPGRITVAADRIGTGVNSHETRFVGIERATIPIASDTYQWIFMPEADEVLRYSGLSVDEILRVLDPGGWIWLTFDTDSELSTEMSVFHLCGCADASAVSSLDGGRRGHRILRKVDETTVD